MTDPTRESHDAVTTPVGVTTLCPQCGASMPAFETRCSGCGHHRATGTEGERTEELRRRLQTGVGDAYELVDMLGKGGMGVVFRAKEKALDREVALKVLAFDPVMAPDAFARFEREAKLAARLDHPHIVPIFAVGQGRGIAFYTMRLVRGGSLEELLTKETRLEPERAIRYLKEIAMALDHAHAHGVVHRDIKPANVMLGDGDHVFVADFGIARAVEGGGTQLTSTGVIGSPAYMAPEQWQGQAIDGRADQYAFGILAYELLTGKRPYRDATMHELLRLHLTEDLPDISQDLARATPEMRDALRKATAKDAKDRFASTGDFVKALEGSLPVGKLPLAAAARTMAAARPTAPVLAEKRSKALPIGIGAGFVAAAVTAVFVINANSNTTPALPPAPVLPNTVVVIQKAPPDTVRLAAPPSVSSAPTTGQTATGGTGGAAGQGTSVGAAVGDAGRAAGAALGAAGAAVGAGRGAVFPPDAPSGYIMVAHPLTPRGVVRIDTTTTNVSGPPIAIPVAPGRHRVSYRSVQGPSYPDRMDVFVRPGDTVRVFFVPAQGGGAEGDSARARAKDLMDRMNAGRGQFPQRGRGGGRGGPPQRGRGDTLDNNSKLRIEN